MSEQKQELTGLEIAVIGMACKLPGANDIDQFWKNLCEGVESIATLSYEDLEKHGDDPEFIRQPDYVRAVRMIDDPMEFDAAFFGSSPREAEILDPQKRHFLECSWQALENAGYDPETYDGLIGVYAGEKLSAYLINLYSHPEVVGRMGEFQIQIANDKDYLATRIAYKLSLGGPAVTVQSACSTSLVAAHLGCQTLLSGECDMVLAGGVSVKADPVGYMFREGEIYSRDGHIRAFDANATGTIFGNGLGVVVLKRLEDALADGDNIRAVIKGSAVNNDSNVKVGYAAPGADGQVRVIRAAQTVSEVDPSTISYIETHGTGTSTGDPIEISALTRAFRESTEENQFCAIASLKSNIGHLGAAAGVAGLIKTTLCLENKMLPPSINFDEPNPQIDFESSPFFVNTELRPWETNGAPRRAGLSAFGIGGTNAHAVLEEAPAPAPTSGSRSRQLLLISARTDTALAQATENLANHLEAHPELDLADVAFTLMVGRKAFEHRRLLVAESREDAIEALRNDPKRLLTMLTDGRKRPVAFMFSGQGAQYAGMGRGLYEAEEVFRQAVDHCCDILEPHLGLDLRTLMYPAEQDMESASEVLSETKNTQPALFVIEYATAKLWMSWGITPDAMLGHSVGEYVAACLAGVFTVEEGLALVAARGRMMQSLPAGDMLSVPMSEEDLKPRLGPQVSIAAINAPGRSVVSGPKEAIEALSQELKAEKVRCVPLHTSHAFHSGMMEPILQPFIEEVRKVDLKAPQIPYVSNVTGTWITEDQALDPNYYAMHLRGAVRFLDGVGELLVEPDRVLLEVGPGNSLSTLSSRHPAKQADHRVLSSIRHPKAKEADDLAFLLESMGTLWLSGVRFDWQAFYGEETRRRVPLPTYPFERRRFFIMRDNLGGFAPSPGARTRKELADWFELPSWKPSVAPRFLEPVADGEEAERWLLFLDDEGVGQRMAERLEALGHQVMTVSRGDAFADLGSGAFELPVAERESYGKLVAALSEAETMPHRVVHLWNLQGQPPEVAAAQDNGFFSLLYLAQSLGKKPTGQRMPLLVVSNDMQRLGFDTAESRQPQKAALLGPVQVTNQEMPFIASSSVDISLSSGQVGDETIELLLAETAAGHRGDIVAYRQGERWQRAYEPVSLDGVAEERLRLKPKGVYLITGGLGGFGLTFSEFLARDHQARLVLVGRRGLPPREEWDGYLSEHDEGDRTARQIRQVRELEALGGEVLVLSADITDADSVRSMLEQARQHFGDLDGVIHAAGIAGGGLMQLKTAEAAAGVLAPKMQGTLALAEGLGDAPLDFFVLCSSTIAVLGTFGQVDYCAANSFMDSFAEARAGHASNTLSINWGAWQDVGMAVETQSPGLQAAGAKKEGAAPAASDVAMVNGSGTEASAPAPVVETEGVHPLLDRRVAGQGKQAIYSSQLDVSRHWVLDEHRIVGKPAIPGTTYLELARAAFTDHVGAENGVEIEDIFFFQPLMVPEGQTVEIRVILEPADKGDDYVFRVVSRAADGPQGPRWMDHVRGKVGASKGTAAQTYDLAEITGRCEKQFDSLDGDTFGTGDDKLVYWGPRWQVLQTIHLGDNEGLAKLSLADEFVDDLAALDLHPAMVDVATALTSGLTEGDNYLPLSYHRVRVYGALPQTIYSYLRMVGDATSGETVTANISLLDEQGKELVAIERFAMKRVGAAKERLAADTPKPKEEKKDEGLFAAGGMKPAHGVEALRRVLSRVRQPRVIVSPKGIQALRDQMAAATMNISGITEGGGQGTAVQESHPRPNLPVPYTEPSNEVEEKLAAIWQGVLGLDKVGVHDNFFDLGGDSVLGITVISQTSEAGLDLSPEQLFEHQTIAELATVLAAAGDQAEGSEVAEEIADSALSGDQLDEALALLDEI